MYVVLVWTNPNYEVNHCSKNDCWREFRRTRFVATGTSERINTTAETVVFLSAIAKTRKAENA